MLKPFIGLLACLIRNLHVLCVVILCVVRASSKYTAASKNDSSFCRPASKSLLHQMLNFFVAPNAAHQYIVYSHHILSKCGMATWQYMWF
jgi:hypothetical protein